MQDMTVAKTILAQLGGAGFVAMTGAKHFVGSDNGLSFRIGRNDRGVTHVRIELDPSDTYTMTFSRVHGKRVTQKAQHSDVYADDLQRLFTDATGMVTRMPTIRITEV